MADAEVVAIPPAEPVGRTRDGVLSGLVRSGTGLALRVERFGLLWLGALSLAYWGITLFHAHHKLMWNDELYTYYLARLPAMSDVRAALLAGGEQLPPLFYVPTRVAFEVFGASHLSLRLPEMLGFWLTSVCLYLVVARRSSPAPAVCAAAFPFVTVAYFYAYEARPYALVLGASALAFVCWQTITLNRHRLVALTGLALSLAAAVSSHYYGVLVILPVALGETVRSLRARRVDLAVWIALAVPVLVLGLHAPLIRAGADYAGTFWSPPQWLHVPQFYEDLLAPAVVPAAALLVFAAAWTAVAPPLPAPPDRSSSVPVHEWAAACGFVLLPLAGVVLAKVATGAFVNRYALPAVIGFAVLAGAGVAAAGRRHPMVRVAALVCLAGWFVLSQARELLEPTGYSRPFSQASVDRPTGWVQAVPDPTLPVVVADPHTFTVLSHYTSPEIRGRLVYAADPDLARKHLGHSSVERGMLDLAGPWFGMSVVEFEPFVAAHARFLVYGDFMHKAFLNWLLQELHARGYRTELLNRAGDNLLVLVSRPAASSGPDSGATPQASGS